MLAKTNAIVVWCLGNYIKLFNILRIEPQGVRVSKSRVFIGSSVEGLNIAYAVQQNLLHDAEVTVWDQGVFELSSTTMESLTKVLGEMDFAIFVFSPDDLIKMRDQTKSVVRDNVLFEFGLFIGKLGRERVFFIIPSTGDFHLPTDLLGVTPAKYESNRTDGSMQAATGPASHQIRQQMKSMGVIPGRIPVDASTKNVLVDDSIEQPWYISFVDKKYDKAKIALEKDLKNESGDVALTTRAWIVYCELKNGNSFVPDSLIDFAKEHRSSIALQTSIAGILRMEGHHSLAIEQLNFLKEKFPHNTDIALALAFCHSESADNESAIAELLRIGPDNSVAVALELAVAFERNEKKDEAFNILQRCYVKHPSDRNLRFKYARIAQDLNQHDIAIYLFNELLLNDEQSVENWGYLANSCFAIELVDKALYAYRKAEVLEKPDSNSQWINSNIGNLFIHKGLSSEACKYLELSVKHEPDSEYAYDRMASALKDKAAENKEFLKKVDEGKRKVREASMKILTTADLV
jgi:predicted nucleotide-binding protein/tetratricopeptide (TPR) repeat protein